MLRREFSDMFEMWVLMAGGTFAAMLYHAHSTNPWNGLPYQLGFCGCVYLAIIAYPYRDR
jgi:hypothetical protein